MSEFDIMMDMYADVSKRLEYIKERTNTMLQLKRNINRLDNNYFENNKELFDSYHILYANKSYAEEYDNLERLKTLLGQHIINVCQHEWFDDCIDVGQNGCQNIRYCVKCELTKK